MSSNSQNFTLFSPFVGFWTPDDIGSLLLPRVLGHVWTKTVTVLIQIHPFCGGTDTLHCVYYLSMYLCIESTVDHTFCIQWKKDCIYGPSTYQKDCMECIGAYGHVKVYVNKYCWRIPPVYLKIRCEPGSTCLRLNCNTRHGTFSLLYWRYRRLCELLPIGLGPSCNMAWDHFLQSREEYRPVITEGIWHGLSCTIHLFCAAV